MFQRFHAMKERKEEGFTLIELLVVILIIAILAAIAIPVFLNQRKKGWISQQESALKNFATNMESYATGHGGDYPTTADEGLVETEGFNPVDQVAVEIVASDEGVYCLSATHEQPVPVLYYSSETGAPTEDTCA